MRLLQVVALLVAVTRSCGLRAEEERARKSPVVLFDEVEESSLEQSLLSTLCSSHDECEEEEQDNDDGGRGNFLESRVLCVIYTHEKNHEAARVAQQVWGQHCDGFIAFSNVSDATVPIVTSSCKERVGFWNSWEKLVCVYNDVWRDYGRDFEYFFFGNDDTYVRVAQLKQFISHHARQIRRYKQRPGLYAGRRFIYSLNPDKDSSTQYQFNSIGAGYILDSFALGSLVDVIPNVSAAIPHACSVVTEMKGVDVPCDEMVLSEFQVTPAVYVSKFLLTTKPYPVTAFNTLDCKGRERFHDMSPRFIAFYQERTGSNQPLNRIAPSTISFHKMGANELLRVDKYVSGCTSKQFSQKRSQYPLDDSGLTEGNDARVAYITAVFGHYDPSCKHVVKQTVPTDMFFFTDNEDSCSGLSNWTVITTPYHLSHPSPVDNGTFRNSLSNNPSPFNVAKYYKQQWHLIPLLQKYDIVIWLDGSVEVTNEDSTRLMLEALGEDASVAAWEHPERSGLLLSEVKASYMAENKYNKSEIFHQYQSYVQDGYSDEYWKRFDSREHFGVWYTVMVIFRVNHSVKELLDIWYLQTLLHSLQDQVSFPYALWRQRVLPSTLPNKALKGNYDRSIIHVKRPHRLPVILADVYGGLGNQLFIVAHALSYSRKFGINYLLLDRTKVDASATRRNYWGSLFQNVATSSEDANKFKIVMSKNEWNETIAHVFLNQHNSLSFLAFVEPQPPLLSQLAPSHFSRGDFYAVGYFQSPDVFAAEWSWIKQTLSIPTFREQVRQKAIRLHRDLNFNETISLHFRLGDYVKYSAKHPVLSMSYYVKALQYIVDSTSRSVWTVQCFYETENESLIEPRISYLQRLFPDMDFRTQMHSLGLNDEEDMMLISLCSIQIIANSCYSWWGAFLNDGHSDYGLKVIYPSILTQFSKNIVPKDPSWRAIRTHFLGTLDEGLSINVDLHVPIFEESTDLDVTLFLDAFCRLHSIVHWSCDELKQVMLQKLQERMADLPSQTTSGLTSGSRPVAYVLTVDSSSERAKHALSLLQELGFSAIPVVAQKPYGDSELSKVWSNRKSFEFILRRHLASGTDEWAFIFEDDITVPSESSSALRATSFWELQQRHEKFVYLGICVPPYALSATTDSACGRCAHAMAISIAGIIDLLEFIESNNDGYRDIDGKLPSDQPYFDMVVENWCVKCGGFPVLLGDVASPQSSSHYGAFYQDRTKYSSLISPDKAVEAAPSSQSDQSQQQAEGKYMSNLKSICEALPILFPLAPGGDNQLREIMAKRPFREKAFYPTVEDIFSDLYHSASSPYDSVHNLSDPFPGEYESYAQLHKEKIILAVRAALQTTPRFVVEVGTFIGSGAIYTLGELAREGGGICLCIDTWQGDLNMRLGEQFQKFMQLRGGFPTTHELFMQRVKAHGMHNVVFPLPMPSMISARLLFLLKYNVDVIYLDSAHEQGETLVELHMMYQLVRPGGVLMGDDFNWPAVKLDVNTFADCNDLPIYIIDGTNQWLIIKHEI